MKTVRRATLGFWLWAVFLTKILVSRASGAAGDIYVGEFDANDVIKIDRAGAKSAFTSQVPSPFGVAFGPNGELYVASSTQKVIFKFAADGARTTFASQLSGPIGLCVDQSGNLYEADNGGRSVLKFAPDGSRSTVISGAFAPYGLAIDSSGNLYASDFQSGSIFRITPNGSSTTVATGLQRPTGVAVGAEANIFVAEMGAGAITRITPTGARSTFATGLDNPLGLVFDRAGNLLVTEHGAGTVLKFTPDGKSSTVATGLSLPTFLAVEPARLFPLNISTRLRASTGENVLIGGFIITGTTSSRVVVRAIGPSLSNANINGALQDPILELRDSSGGLLRSNDDWKDLQRSELENTGIAPTDDRESAMVTTLPSGAYTAIVRGKAETTGVALVEVYNLDGKPDSELANISTRGVVGSGENVMIGGFILGGGDGKAVVVVRALGPSLSASGIANPLPDPTIELHDSNGGLLAENNDWQDDHRAEIEATGIPPGDALESAIVATLAGGNYTVIVAGHGGATGVGLVEVYHLL